MNKLSASTILAAAFGLSGVAFAGAPSHTTMPTVPPEPVALAQHFYAGAGLNYGAVVRNQLLGLEKHAIGANLFVGNRLTKHFSEELVYNYVGDQVFSVMDDVSAGEEARVTNIHHLHYDGIFSIPLCCPSLEGFAKAGVGYMLSKQGGAHIGSFALNYGLGVQYSYEQFGLRAGYTHIVRDSFPGLVSFAPDTVNLDLVYQLS